MPTCQDLVIFAVRQTNNFTYAHARGVIRRDLLDINQLQLVSTELLVGFQPQYCDTKH